MLTNCPWCLHLAWEGHHQPAPDRNGARHHPLCLVIARDRHTDRILCSAWRIAHAGDDGVTRPLSDLRAAMHEYEAWREERQLPPLRFEDIIKDERWGRQRRKRNQ